VEEQKDELLKRLEKLFQNSDTGMTRDRYLELCEQMGNEPVEEEIPPSWEDFPEMVVNAVATFNSMGDRIQAEVGYIGKDYTNLNHYLEVYGVEDKEFFLQLLNWLDARAIKKSSEEMKRQLEKMKRQTSGKRS